MVSKKPKRARFRPKAGWASLSFNFKCGQGGFRTKKVPAFSGLAITAVINVELKTTPRRGFESIFPVIGGKNHGWALRYVCGLVDVDAGNDPLWICDWQAEGPGVFFRVREADASIWAHEEEARHNAELLRRNHKIETHPEYV